MLKRFKLSVIAVLCFAGTAAQADFLPKNNLHLQDNVRSANMTEAEFNAVIDEAEAYYKPLIDGEHGGSFKVNRRWSDSTVNASASQFFGGWTVNMYGGLARRPEVTRDGFALVLCHEIGHHVAGYPFSSAWAANEGASDYFATLSCARSLWGKQLEKNALSRETIGSFPKAACDKVWEDEAEQNLCYRSMEASISLATLLAALNNQKVDFQKPDPKIVSSTNHSHPAGQCRLDTYAAGALCKQTFDEKVIPGKELGSKRNSIDAERATSGSSCLRTDFQEGMRPLCWFKPFL